MNFSNEQAAKAEQIIKIYALFGINIKGLIDVSYEDGITKFDFEVEPHTDFSKIIKYRDDVSLMLSVPPVTLISPLPDKAAFRIEIPTK